MKEMTYKIAGAMAAVWFFAALFTFGARYPGYSQLTRAISELGAFGAPDALAWNILGFIVPGLLIAICGAGVAVAVDGCRTLLFWLLVVAGLAFSGVGLAPAVMYSGSPVLQSPWTAGHIVVSSLSGAVWVIGSVVLVGHVSRRTQRANPKSLALFLCVLAFAGIAVNIFARAMPLLADTPGLSQRIAFGAFFAWYLLAALIFVPSSQSHRYASA